MRIPDVRSVRSVGPGIDGELSASRCSVPKPHPTHPDRYRLVGTGYNLDADDAAKRGHRGRARGSKQPAVVEVSRRDSEPIPTLFSLATVGIEDPEDILDDLDQALTKA